MTASFRIDMGRVKKSGWRVYYCLGLLMLAACTGVPPAGHSSSLPAPSPPLPALSPPLPALSALGCCWAVQEIIVLKAPGVQQQLQAALAVKAEQHTLVLLDPLGNKLLQSTRTERGLTTEFDSSDGLIPVQQLWAALHLVRAENWKLSGSRFGSGSGSESESHSGWSLEQGPQGRSLRYNGRLWAQATNTLAFNDSTGKAKVRFPGQSLTIGITTVQAVQL